MKLSVSFRQVWHGAVWTLTTESSERSTRAGRKGQADHMVLQKAHTELGFLVINQSKYNLMLSEKLHQSAVSRNPDITSITWM